MTGPVTPHQRGIIRRYYENRDDIMSQKLSEIVSDLYMCSDPQKAARLWKSARTALNNLNAPPGKVEKCVTEKNLQMLAEIVSDLF